MSASRVNLLWLSQCRRSSLVCHPTSRFIRLNSTFSTSSELGVRRSHPPDSNARPDPQKPRLPPPEITDQDWEIRTGRAIFVVTQTLPEFFTTGLISSVDKATGEPRLSPSIPALNVNPLDFHHASNSDSEPIYSPRVRLSYTPPARLPPPFPRTLQVEGLSLYLTSSMFVRHTLNALYSNVEVTMNKVVVNTPGSSQPSSVMADSEVRGPVPKSREKSLFVGLTVNGTSRVSGAPGEWEVNSTYTFSPLTGLIHVHTVNSILPAPHDAVFDSLRASLGKMLGMGFEGNPETRPGGAGAACDSGGVEPPSSKVLVQK